MTASKTTAPFRQAPHAVVMVLPHHFYPNEQTAADNAYQVEAGQDRASVARRAYAEVKAAAQQLEAAGVTVHLFEDLGGLTPDSVFPNNWFSTHGDGRLVLYPMYAPSRRAERRQDIVEFLRHHYQVTDVVDYAAEEKADRFLEGTGAMVLDHREMVAYVSLSHRADALLVERFCTEFGYAPVTFETHGPDGQPIYHTNVMMNIGSKMALVGFDCINTEENRRLVRDQLAASGRLVIDLAPDQIDHFAGNALEVRGAKGLVLVLSTTAERSLTTEQRATIETEMPIVALDVPTIEMAGGSARCMLAGVHLPPR